MHEVLGFYKYTWLARLHGGSSAMLMNLEAQPWTADFPFSAALDIFACRFRGRWGVVLHFLTCAEFSGMGFTFFVLPTPPLTVGVGLGNRTTHLWHRIRFRSFGLGLGDLWRIPLYFPCFCRFPPAREPGAIWIELTTHIWGTGPPRFRFSVDAFSTLPPRGW